MINIYYAANTQKLDEDSLFHYLSLLPLQMKEKILKFRRWEDAQASLFGKLLLRKGFEELGLPYKLDALLLNDFGRPYLSELDFNISHAGEYVVCIISSQAKVGIDIEKIKPIKIEDFRSQFIESEWEHIISSNNNIDMFYQY